MVVCKYYLQGNCTWGSNCKFEHCNAAPDQRTNNSRMQGQSILRQNQPAKEAVDTDTIVRAVQNDMLSTEKGQQWILSCYAPFKEKGMFPGFQDRSVEEVRFGYYEAHGNGTLELYKQQLHNLQEETAMKIRSLQYPTPELINKVKEIYNSISDGVHSIIQQQSSSLFQVASATTPSSIFAGGQHGNIPQAPAVTGSIFGAQQTAFPLVSNSIFGGQQLAGAPINNSPLFGAADQQNNARYGSGPQTVENNSMMSAASTPSPFHNTINELEMTGVADTNAQHANRNVFAQAPSIANTDSSVYTPIDNLSANALQAYQQPIFQMKHIPEQPPPYHLCTH